LRHANALAHSLQKVQAGRAAADNPTQEVHMWCRTAWSWCALGLALVSLAGCSPHFDFGADGDGTDLEAPSPLVYRVVAASDLPGDVLQLFFPPEPGLARYVPARVQAGIWAGEWRVTGVRLVLADGRTYAMERDGDDGDDTTWSARFADPSEIAGGGRVQASFTRDDGAMTLTRAFDAQPLRLNALSLAEGAGGTIWAGTSHSGLLALRREEDGHVTSLHYAGCVIGSDHPQDFAGPAANMVTRIARQGERGLWLGSPMRGVAWLDPGKDAFAKGDDRWAHHVPDPGFACSDEEFDVSCNLAQTVTALLPDGETGLWVGTLNGLYHLDHGGNPEDVEAAVWTRLLDGPVTSLALAPDRVLWVGFATSLGGPSSGLDGWPAAASSLAALRDGGTPTDLRDDAVSNHVLDGAPDGTPAPDVLSLARVDGALFAGTDRGILAFDATGDVPARPRLTRWDEADLPDGDVLALGLAPDGALWAGAFDVCGTDGGALVRLDLRGTPLDPTDDVRVAYTAADGLKDADVSGIAFLASGEVAFTTFDLDPRAVADTLGASATAADEGCRPTGHDGLTLLDPGRDPASKADDVLFDF
jgi:hypothetical protein